MADEKATGAGEASAAPTELRAADAAALKPRPPRSASPKMKPRTPEDGDLARRNFIWYSFAGFFTLLAACAARFFFPRVLFEPKTRFAIGYPDEFGFGVDTKYQQQYRIWVCRNAAGLYVIYARCTHLGCTPDWKEGENKFKCPCHGSGFDTEGINYEGPAPKPMLRCHLELDPVGRVMVDTLNLYEHERFKDAKPSLSGPLLSA